jgi:hypothetical protein
VSLWMWGWDGRSEGMQLCFMSACLPAAFLLRTRRRLLPSLPPPRLARRTCVGGAWEKKGHVIVWLTAAQNNAHTHIHHGSQM